MVNFFLFGSHMVLVFVACVIWYGVKKKLIFTLKNGVCAVYKYMKCWSHFYELIESTRNVYRQIDMETPFSGCFIIIKSARDGYSKWLFNYSLCINRFSLSVGSKNVRGPSKVLKAQKYQESKLRADSISNIRLLLIFWCDLVRQIQCCLCTFQNKYAHVLFKHILNIWN